VAFQFTVVMDPMVVAYEVRLFVRKSASWRSKTVHGMLFRRE